MRTCGDKGLRNAFCCSTGELPHRSATRIRTGDLQIINVVPPAFAAGLAYAGDKNRREFPGGQPGSGF